MRSVRMHTWPEWMKLDHAAASAARSRFAPGRTMNGDLPPSSVTHGISRSPQREAIFRPVATEPVNMTASTRSTSTAPAAPRGDLERRRRVSRGRPEVAQHARREGGDLGGLEHDRVAGQERRDGIGRVVQDREIPGADDAHDAERVPHEARLFREEKTRV